MVQEPSTASSIIHPYRKEYLPIDEQWRIRGELEEIAKTVPLTERIGYQYAHVLCGIPMGVLYFLTWRAGYRGFGIYKFGKGRIMTIASTMIFPMNGVGAHAYVNSKMVDPYRRESPWYWAKEHAIFNQLGILSCVIGTPSLIFVWANRMGIVPVPEGMDKPEVRRIAMEVFYTRIKSYLKPIAIAAVASTVMSAAVGVFAYKQSCNLLAKMGRRTLSEKEDSTQM